MFGSIVADVAPMLGIVAAQKGVAIAENFMGAIGDKVKIENIGELNAVAQGGLTPEGQFLVAKYFGSQATAVAGRHSA